jgi:3-oxoacyl-[acyl-carrier protein] reductase
MTNNEDAPVAIITGGSRGIGRATAERLARDGFRIVFTYLEREETAIEVVGAIDAAGGEARAVRADLAKREEVLSIFTAADEAFGRLDALVLNAAAIPYGPLTEISEDDFDWAFAVNTKAAFFAFREAAKRLSAGGRIVGISTGLTRNPMAESNAYAASKAALEVLVRSFAQEVGPREITVNALLPGITDTEGLQIPQQLIETLVQQTPLRRLGRPSDLADVVSFLVSKDSGWVTGQTIYASGGLA